MKDFHFHSKNNANFLNYNNNFSNDFNSSDSIKKLEIFFLNNENYCFNSSYSIKKLENLFLKYDNYWYIDNNCII